MDPAEPRPELIGTWFRSFEEEADGVLIFRPPDYPFPPARAPRPAVRLEAGGTAVALRGGPSDQLEPAPGTGSWAAIGSTLVLRTAELSGDFHLEVVDPDRLVLRRLPVSPDRTESPE
jgi:hypothetical protein